MGTDRQGNRRSRKEEWELDTALSRIDQLESRVTQLEGDYRSYTVKTYDISSFLTLLAVIVLSGFGVYYLASNYLSLF